MSAVQHVEHVVSQATSQARHTAHATVRTRVFLGGDLQTTSWDDSQNIEWNKMALNNLRLHGTPEGDEWPGQARGCQGAHPV